MKHKMPPLTDEEKRIILDRGTEAPGSGRYWRHQAVGSYLCRQCGEPLFTSDQKFDSACGWPSFDEALPSAVEQKPDPDGRRTEIVCANCGGHLGHVFCGEKLTPKDTRYCVNSLSMSFKPQAATESAVFAGGCFWGLEAAFKAVPGVCSALSGYTGGKYQNPSYEQVSSGQTGHAEAVKVTFDPKRISFESLARIFFEIHNPTQFNRQGPDIGTQYRSAFFYQNDQQKEVVEKLIMELKSKDWPVVTALEPFEEFYPAEEYHQDYFNKHSSSYICHRRVSRFSRDYDPKIDG